MATAEHAGRATSVPAVDALLSAANKRSVAVAALVIVIVAVLAIFGWSEWRHTTGTPAVSTAPAAVSGVVVYEGGPPPPPGSNQSDIHPVPSAPLVVKGTTAAGIRLLRHLSTDSHGRFTLNLPPGVYTVTAVIFGPASRSLATQPHAKVIVRRGHPVRIQIKGYVI
jgi:hypothetical protein